MARSLLQQSWFDSNASLTARDSNSVVEYLVANEIVAGSTPVYPSHRFFEFKSSHGTISSWQITAPVKSSTLLLWLAK